MEDEIHTSHEVMGISSYVASALVLYNTIAP